MVVVNPNNPTGHFLTKVEWAELTNLCARRGLALLVDEVFADYALEVADDQLATALLDPTPSCPVFLLSGLSKVAALPQLKLGWIAVRGPGAAAGLEALAFLADQYLSVSRAVQAAAPAPPRAGRPIRPQILGRLRTNLATLDAALAHQPQLSGCRWRWLVSPAAAPRRGCRWGLRPAPAGRRPRCWRIRGHSSICPVTVTWSSAS
ncbi:MAG: aminotransferase class I/II-fold pyridoxal phosphate-dependent enzyme [Holophagaceae bacterium]|nr:aminotransferase class I/II-fold pyridoxal phosphate-dependent enzyme [Holophagaceae bacterium]